MRKYFDTEYEAKAYVEKNGGTIEVKYLPNYMWVDTVWVVTINKA